MNFAAKNDPMIPQFAEIKKIFWETDDTFSLILDTSELNHGNYNFKPGQFNMLYCFGIGESAISISSDPQKPRTIHHTIHRVGTVTGALSRLKKGDFIGVRGPFGSDWHVNEIKGYDILIAAGGIGLAPLRPVIYSLLRHRKDYGKIYILYGARSPLDLLYRVELEEWNKKLEVNVLTTVDRGDSSWKGNIGVVTNLFHYVKLDARATAAFICGPEIMMYYALQEALDFGIEEDKIFLSLERNMKCAVGFCGHCQYGPKFICKDGPVFSYPQIIDLFNKKEL